jgi:hypothetical protein
MEGNGEIQPDTVFESPNLKNEAENELLIKVGAKEEEVFYNDYMRDISILIHFSVNKKITT